MTGQEAAYALSVKYEKLGKPMPQYDWAEANDYGEDGKPTPVVNEQAVGNSSMTGFSLGEERRDSADGRDYGVPVIAMNNDNKMVVVSPEDAGNFREAAAIPFNEFERWDKLVDGYVDGKLDVNRPLTVINRTPEIIQKAIEIAGGNDFHRIRPISIHVEALDKITDENIYSNVGKHGVSIKELRKLQLELDNPVAIFYSQTRPDTSIIILTELVDGANNSKAIVALQYAYHPNGNYMVLKPTNANKIASIYGRRKGNDYSDFKPIYINTTKAESLGGVKRLQLPFAHNSRKSSSANVILTEKDFSMSDKGMILKDGKLFNLESWKNRYRGDSATMAQSEGGFIAGKDLEKIVPPPTDAQPGNLREHIAELDARYERAYRLGDKATAQKMVDDFIADYQHNDKRIVWRGDATEWNEPSNKLSMVFFADDKQEAQSYADNRQPLSGHSRSPQVRQFAILPKDGERVVAEKDLPSILNGSATGVSFEQYVGDLFDNNPREVRKLFGEHGKKQAYIEKARNVAKIVADEAKSQFGFWNLTANEKNLEKHPNNVLKRIAPFLVSQGVIGVRYWDDTSRGENQTTAIFSQTMNRVKSTAPFVRGKDGKLIPFSKRFDLDETPWFPNDPRPINKLHKDYESYLNDKYLDSAGNLREGKPNGVQKSANVNYPNASKDINMMFAGNLREGMGNKRKAEAERLITKKRPDLKDDAKRLVDEIAKFDSPKEQKAALHWMIAGSIRLPEDAYKVSEAIGYGERAKGKGETDAMKYKSPMEMIEALHEFKPKAKPIDPDTVPELSNKREMGYGVTTYLVQDDREGQQAMRKIINTHWGEDANPWCLLCGDGKGNLRDDAWEYWQHYNALPKYVAFKDGKLLAFMATSRIDYENWSDARRFEASLAFEFPELKKEYDSWTETEEAIENGIPEFSEWLHINSHINKYERIAHPHEQWWDRQDESHLNLRWAMGNAGNLREAMPKGLSKRQRAILWAQQNERDAQAYKRNVEPLSRGVINTDSIGVAYDEDTTDVWNIEAEHGKLSKYQKEFNNELDEIREKFNSWNEERRIGRGNDLPNNDGNAVSTTAIGNGRLDGVVRRDLRRLPTSRALSEGSQNNSSRHSDSKEITAGNLREAQSFDEHLQARREAMPKVGLERARANVQAALHRNEGETRRAWAKRKAKAIGDFLATKMVDARLPIINAVKEITGGVKLADGVDIATAMQTAYGRVVAEHTNIDNDYVKPVLKTLADNDISLEAFDTYLYAMAASERNKMIFERTDSDKHPGNLSGSGITDEQAITYLEELRNRMRVTYVARQSKLLCRAT